MRVLGNATSEASRLFSQANPSVRSLKARRERLESGAFVFGTTEPRPSRIGFGLAGGQSDLTAAWLADGSGEMLGHAYLHTSPSGGGLWPPRRLPFQLESRPIRL